MNVMTKFVSVHKLSQVPSVLTFTSWAGVGWRGAGQANMSREPKIVLRLGSHLPCLYNPS